MKNNQVLLKESPEDISELEFVNFLPISKEMEERALYKIVLAGKLVRFIEVIKLFKLEDFIYKIENDELLNHVKKYKKFSNLKTEKDDLEEDRKRKISLFILELEDGYLYVGITKNVQEAFKDYNNGHNLWTKKHKAVKILTSRELGYSYEEALKKENREVEKLRAQIGKEMVSGGKYLDLEEWKC